MDLDGDGRRDILSGSWPGELFLFRGRADGSFGAAELLEDKDGRPINIGGGVTTMPDGNVLITGHTTVEKTPEGRFVVYQGQRFRSSFAHPTYGGGTASAVHAADWDADGDLDLLVGNIEGKVFLVPNEGTPSSYAFGRHSRIEAGGAPIEAGADAGPFAADWDGDGRLDLLVGGEDGSVSYFRNTGTSAGPVLAAAQVIVPPGKEKWSPGDLRRPVRGSRSKVCAVDWDGDGRLDLLVGDNAQQRPDRPRPTRAQKAEHERIRQELEVLSARHQELINKYLGPQRSAEVSPEEEERVRTELEDLMARRHDLQKQLPQEKEPHGWVWLFRRKPPAASSEG